jgi:hypothetical protein
LRRGSVFLYPADQRRGYLNTESGGVGQVERAAVGDRRWLRQDRIQRAPVCVLIGQRKGQDADALLRWLELPEFETIAVNDQWRSWRKEAKGAATRQFWSHSWRHAAACQHQADTTVLASRASEWSHAVPRPLGAA